MFQNIKIKYSFQFLKLHMHELRNIYYYLMNLSDKFVFGLCLLRNIKRFKFNRIYLPYTLGMQEVEDNLRILLLLLLFTI